MFRNSCQRGRLTIFFSVGSKPLNNWETHCKDGYITRFLDPDIKSMVLEIGGVNVSTTYMTCPPGNKVLGITMPFLVMIVKNMKKYFTFEITILDETGTRRRFRVANFQSQTQILPLSTVMPINLADGWNQIQFNLYEFTQRAYNKHFVEVQKLKINANIRLRRIYFTEKLVSDDDLPPEYRIYFPLKSPAVNKGKKDTTIIQTNIDKVDDKGKISNLQVSSEQKVAQPIIEKSVTKLEHSVQLAETEREKPPNQTTTGEETKDVDNNDNIVTEVEEQDVQIIELIESTQDAVTDLIKEAASTEIDIGNQNIDAPPGSLITSRAGSLAEVEKIDLIQEEIIEKEDDTTT